MPADIDMVVQHAGGPYVAVPIPVYDRYLDLTEASTVTIMRDTAAFLRETNTPTYEQSTARSLLHRLWEHATQLEVALVAADQALQARNEQ